MMCLGLLGLTWLLQQTFLTIADWKQAVTVDEEFERRNQEYMRDLLESLTWVEESELEELGFTVIDHEE